MESYFADCPYSYWVWWEWFEKENPNVEVIGGINGDFYHINTSGDPINPHIRDYEVIWKGGNNSAAVVAEFDLDTNTLKKIRTSLGVFKNADCISFNSKDNELFVKVETNSRFETNSNSFSVHFDGTPEKEFKIKLSTANFSLLPICNYKVKVIYSSKNDNYTLHLSSSDIPEFEIVLAALL